ncbi:rRNA maturation RNase YbeY [soil metagenome]
MSAGVVVEAQEGEGVTSPTPLGTLEDVVRFVLVEQKISSAEISITLLADQEITRLNEQYLGHSGATDVITFPLDSPTDRVVGDIYIGVEQAARQAEELALSVEDELLRLSVHGTLHVLGFEHPEDDQRESSPMYHRQEELLLHFQQRMIS